MGEEEGRSSLASPLHSSPSQKSALDKIKINMYNKGVKVAGSELFWKISG
jgi:hypothetical protein